MNALLAEEDRAAFSRLWQMLEQAGMAGDKRQCRVWVGDRQIFGPPEDIDFWCWWDGERMRKRD